MAIKSRFASRAEPGLGPRGRSWWSPTKMTNYEIGRRVGIVGRGGCVTGWMWVVVRWVPVPDLVPEGNQGEFRIPKKSSNAGVGQH